MIKLDLETLEEEVREILFERTREVQFHSGEIVVEMGSVCQDMFFIQKGMMRNFYYDGKGNDITHWFASEDMIITVPPSFFKRTPSSFGIEAVEATTVRAISFDRLEEEFKDSIHLERFCRLLVTDIMITLGRKIIDLQTKSAEYRYDQLLQTHPDIFHRAKLGHIAGYLGVKQQSLSRIRALKRSG